MLTKRKSPASAKRCRSPRRGAAVSSERGAFPSRGSATPFRHAPRDPLRDARPNDDDETLGAPMSPEYDDAVAWARASARARRRSLH